MAIFVLWRPIRSLVLVGLALITLHSGVVSASAAAQTPKNLFCFPTAGTFTQGFSEKHSGLDISSTSGGKGAPIYSPYKGTVVYIGGDRNPDPKFEKKPHIVAIDHGWIPERKMRVLSTYGHMGTKHKQAWESYIREDLKVGDVVERGTLIGYQGQAGNVTGTHLHWEIHQNKENKEFTSAFEGVAVDPQIYTGTPPTTIKGANVCSSEANPTPTQSPAAPSYIITAANSEKCLDVDNWGKQNGANTWQWTCHNGANQQWRKETLPNGYLRLINVNSKKCLDVANQSRDNGANVHQWDCHDGDSQQWWPIELKGSPFYIIKNRRSDKCLDVSGESTTDGGNVQQWDCHGRNNQQWAFSAPGSSPPKATQPAPQQPKPEPAPQPPVPGTTPPQPSVPGQLPPAQQAPARPVLTYIKVYKSGANVYGDFCIDADGYTLQWGSVGRWDSGAPRSNGAIKGCRTGVWFFADVTDARETLWVQIVAKASGLERTYKVAIRNTGGSCQLEANDTPLREPTECTFTNA